MIKNVVSTFRIAVDKITVHSEEEHHFYMIYRTCNIRIISLVTIVIIDLVNKFLYEKNYTLITR